MPRDHARIHTTIWRDREWRGVTTLVPPRRWIRPSLRAAVYERDGNTCLHCGATEALTLDHIHPWSLGGEDTFENLQTLCRSCNSKKGGRA